MSDSQTKSYNEIRKLALKTNKQLKELRKDSDRENPVDIDMIKTTKAMFYEECIEIFKRNRDN